MSAVAALAELHRGFQTFMEAELGKLREAGPSRGCGLRFLHVIAWVRRGRTLTQGKPLKRFKKLSFGRVAKELTSTSTDSSLVKRK